MRPVGEQREPPVDVRILSATHKNLDELVAAGAVSARTCTTASTSSSCACRRCANAARTFRSSPMPSCIGCRAGSASTRHGSRPRRSSCCATFPSRATCASWRTCWNVRWRCATRDASTSATCSCARYRAPTPRRALARGARAAARCGRAGPRRGNTGARGARRTARGRGTRRHRQGAGSGALQQDRRGQGARHDLPRAALPHQETRDRVIRSRWSLMNMFSRNELKMMLSPSTTISDAANATCTVSSCAPPRVLSHFTRM